MPLNTSLLPPPVEADFNALFAFDDKELVIDPNEEIVSGMFRGYSMILKFKRTPLASGRGLRDIDRVQGWDI